ncbi:YraN family protein [Odoribacter sp. OttesenSCG-928-A06]|nr:YraN family protein [Odoribacter sp. OttesenSCG-928-A06]
MCNSLGKIGEDRAVTYLKGLGYTILERNWRVGHKEVDVICMDGEVVVVVEVKFRNGVTERPDELLDYKKRRNLLRAGSAYLSLKNLKKEMRFDLIIVTGDQKEIEHIREAIQIFDV